MWKGFPHQKLHSDWNQSEQQQKCHCFLRLREEKKENIWKENICGHFSEISHFHASIEAFKIVKKDWFMGKSCTFVKMFQSMTVKDSGQGKIKDWICSMYTY